jgi:threonine aldolase
MRQAGSLAAAGKYALENHRALLPQDHRRAKELEKALQTCKHISGIEKVHTNIVIAHVDAGFGLESFMQFFAKQNIHFLPFGKHSFRMVTHFQFTDEMLDKTIQVIRQINAA